MTARIGSVGRWVVVLAVAACGRLSGMRLYELTLR